MKKLLTSLILFIIVLIQANSQVYSDKIVGAKNEALKDSLKKQEYPYALPILGKQAAAMGFDLPYSAGLGINVLTQQSDLVIDNLMVGFNNGEMINIDQIVRFNNAQSRATGVNLRPDIWLFPFLNVYGIFARAHSSTSIDAGIWIPDQNNNWQEILPFSTKANFEATTVGFGLTPTIGVGGGWMALDMNCAWSDVNALDKPVFTFVFGPRFGKSFKLKKPQQSLTFWAGGFRLKFSSATSGSLNLNELMDTEGLQSKVDNGLQKVADNQAQVNTWWDNLTATEQRNPVNQAKYNTANRALSAAGNFLNAADGALNNDQYASVQYALDKRVKDMWNFIVGSQFQLNKHFMIRGEYGFLGSRQQFLGGLQYRFGL
jgi:hypothetical protein